MCTSYKVVVAFLRTFFKFILVSAIHVLKFRQFCLLVNEATSRVFKLAISLICRVLLLLFLSRKIIDLLCTKL